MVKLKSSHEHAVVPQNLRTVGAPTALSWRGGKKVELFQGTVETKKTREKEKERGREKDRKRGRGGGGGGERERERDMIKIRTPES